MLFPLHDDNPTQRFPVLTVAIIVANFAIFFAWKAQDPHQELVWTVRLGFLPHTVDEIGGDAFLVDLYPGADFYVPEDRRYLEVDPTPLYVGRSILTSLFMHADWLHLGGNMLFLWVFGNNVEDRLGRNTFLLFYLLGGVVAALSHWALAGSTYAMLPVVGASGAVAATLGCYAVAYPGAKVWVFAWICVPLLFRVSAWLLLAGWFMLQFAEAMLERQGLVTHVALWAHIGGFIFGAVCMRALILTTPVGAQVG